LILARKARLSSSPWIQHHSSISLDMTVESQSLLCCDVARSPVSVDLEVLTEECLYVINTYGRFRVSISEFSKTWAASSFLVWCAILFRIEVPNFPWLALHCCKFHSSYRIFIIVQGCKTRTSMISVWMSKQSQEN
jgi:hypothetical protein